MFRRFALGASPRIFTCDELAHLPFDCHLLAHFDGGKILMCGIAGTWGFGDPGLLRGMVDTLTHRGPDGEGFFSDQEAELHLGNRRLAILDVEGGGQPMANEDGSIVVVYNGEIYNSPRLREDLEKRGHVLKTRCDTELLPHLYEEHGIEMLDRLNGIFAFALWDRKERTLWLARDPMGVKPLVYAHRNGRLAFGSESKAVLASGLVSPELDEASLHLTMNLWYIPGRRTLFAGIRRLPPGHALRANASGVQTLPVSGIDWTPDHSLSQAQWIEGIRSHLDAAVERQLLSDVELGVTLSGGIDSTAIVAMIRRRHSGPLRTFTLGFDEPWDENEHARETAHRYGTDHHDLVLTEPAMAHLEDAIRFTEEPKANCLQLYLLHRFIGEHVKVVLSGLGGDELFAGYDFYAYLARLDPARSALPRWLTRSVLRPVVDRLGRAGASLERPGLDLWIRGMEWAGSLHNGARHYLMIRNAWDMNPAMVERVYTPEFQERLAVRSLDEFERYFPGERSIESEALRAEISTKLVNDLLLVEDTMSMAHSVESRVPFLDLELVRFAARIPDDLRFGKGLKGLLKDALGGVIPEETLARKKWGFTMDPVEQFEKNLKPMAREWLTPERVRRGRIFNPAFVENVLHAKPRRRQRWHYFMLLHMIGLEMWREIFVERGEFAPSSSRPSRVAEGGGEG